MSDYVSVEVNHKGERRIVTIPVEGERTVAQVFDQIRAEFVAIETVKAGDA